MQKSDLYFKIKSNIRVYVNFNEIEIQLNNEKNLLVLYGCQTRFIYGLINYLNNYLQFRRNLLLKNKFKLSSSSHFYSIIFINSFNYDLIIRQWYANFICS
jgi:hypothetical protein